ncbi:hypothetical protein [Erythrobacter donghaensis]|uniref:hypothetical protein n=1 Tax=Erythrobacter donghaensis TaxID=267135 RepID=UPI000A370B22|nr:hypothetical protein [Erythrobacter donghaensis]
MATIGAATPASAADDHASRGQTGRWGGDESFIGPTLGKARRIVEQGAWTARSGLGVRRLVLAVHLAV